MWKDKYAGPEPADPLSPHQSAPFVPNRTTSPHGRNSTLRASSMAFWAVYMGVCDDRGDGLGFGWQPVCWAWPRTMAFVHPAFFSKWVAMVVRCNADNTVLRLAQACKRWGRRRPFHLRLGRRQANKPPAFFGRIRTLFKLHALLLQTNQRVSDR